jgi:hypothetical protein
VNSIVADGDTALMVPQLKDGIRYTSVRRLPVMSQLKQFTIFLGPYITLVTEFKFGVTKLLYPE